MIHMHIPMCISQDCLGSFQECEGCIHQRFLFIHFSRIAHNIVKNLDITSYNNVEQKTFLDP